MKPLVSNPKEANREDFKSSLAKPRSENSNSKALKSLISQLNIKSKNHPSKELKTNSISLNIKSLIEKHKNDIKINIKNSTFKKPNQAVSPQSSQNQRNLRFKRLSQKPIHYKPIKTSFRLNDSSRLNSRSPQTKTNHSQLSSPSFASVNTQQCYPSKPPETQPTSQGLSINTINNFNTANIKELTLAQNDPRFVQISEAIFENFEASNRLKTLNKQIGEQIADFKRDLDLSDKPVQAGDLCRIVSKALVEVRGVYPLSDGVLLQVESIVKEFCNYKERLYSGLQAENKKLQEGNLFNLVCDRYREMLNQRDNQKQSVNIQPSNSTSYVKGKQVLYIVQKLTSSQAVSNSRNKSIPGKIREKYESPGYISRPEPENPTSTKSLSKAD